jgi:hypothetical protein
MGIRALRECESRWRVESPWGHLSSRLALLIVAGLAGCGGGSSGTGAPPPSNPVPSITSIAPTSITAGGSAFTLTVNGSSFVSGATVDWNGSTRTTSFMSASQLAASITAGDIASAGTAKITVVNPAPGGGASAQVSFTINAPAPTVTISVNPTSVALGISAMLTWSSTNATSCTASGAWSGSQQTSGSQSVTPTAVGTAAYTLACTGPGGNAMASANLMVTTPPPTIDISVNPNSVALGLSSTLTWSTINAASCTASGAWSGSQPTSGTQSVTPAAVGMATYTLACTGPGGNGTASANLAVTPAPPTVSISVNPTSVVLGISSTLTWSSTNATSCTASGSWSGSQPTSGSQSVTPTAVGMATYSLNCTGAGGTTGASANLTVTPPAPTVTLSSSASTAFVGQPVTLTWSSTYAASCTASGAWSGAQPATGSAVVTPAAAGTPTYMLACTGPGGNGSASTQLTVNAADISVTNAFTPNAVTISTGEGAPYGDCDFWISTAANCTNESNSGYGPTRVMRLYICLTGEVSAGDCSMEPAMTGPIPAQMLTDIDTRLSAFQGTGMRIMPRFIYNFGPIGSTAQDAPMSVILNNLDQLAPIVLKYKDMVFALEAGFIGTWGEWHDSTNGNDTAAAQAQLLNAELSYFGGIFPILERYPGDLIQFTGGLTPPSTIGLHDDYYASADDDGGTWDTCGTSGGWCLTNYSAAQFESFAAQVSTTTMFAGEFGALYPTLQTCAALDEYSYTYHPQSIGLTPYPATIGTELQNEGCLLSFLNQVGTRIELQSASVIGNPTANGQLYVGLTMVNTGYGRVIRQRPATILFLSGATILAQFPLSLSTMDLTQLASSATPVPLTFATTLTLPSNFPAGETVSAVLLVPDPAPSLISQPAYALPLNSLDQGNNSVFQPATGYNLFATFESQ